MGSSYQVQNFAGSEELIGKKTDIKVKKMKITILVISTLVLATAFADGNVNNRSPVRSPLDRIGELMEKAQRVVGENRENFDPRSEGRMMKLIDRFGQRAVELINKGGNEDAIEHASQTFGQSVRQFGQAVRHLSECVN